MSPPYNPKMMKRRLSLLAGLCSGGASAIANAAAPNIVVILVDDMDWSDVGAYGGEIETRHLDALAKGGVRFTQFHHTARFCLARAARLTGLCQHQAGVGHLVGNEGIPSYKGYLNDRCVTRAEVLRPAARLIKP